MSLLVDNPILSSPFEEPTRYWAYEEGQSVFEEEFVPLDLVNTVRERVKAWRQRGYPGVTPITRQLLNHWSNLKRERRLFFCQREAAETLIWLVEASPAHCGEGD
jgi:type III restriction enzyme